MPGAVGRSGWRWAAVLGGAASLAGSVAFALTGVSLPAGNAAAVWGVAETGVLLALTVAAVRAGPPAVAVVPAVAVPAWLLRFSWGPLTAAGLGGFFGWTLAALAAVAVGAYLRRLDGDRRRSVAEARRAQRLHLARDLHDFVAHDVSGMLAQAQAGQLLAGRDPAAAAAAFRRIEQAGLQALAALDRTVHMLSDPRAGPAEGPAGLADVPAVVGRFTGPAEVTLDIESGLELPRELGATAYRVVVEALTNVRRHAPSATHVSVRIARATSDEVAIVVTNDAPTPGAPTPKRRGGGLGLPSLAERVEVLGGSLTAGPRADGWELVAKVPLPA